MNTKKSFIISTCVLLALFLLFTVSLFFVDNKAVGPEDTKVGYSTLNVEFSKLVGTNRTLEKIADVCGNLAFVVIAFFAMIGLIQLLTRKNLFKVDGEILILGSLYIFVLGLYILFNKVAINYRPILEDGKIESSYPSSHTILALVVFISAMFIIGKYVKNNLALKIIYVVFSVLSSVIVITRFLSGVHWLTDIVGGILLSLFLINAFRMCVFFYRNNRQ